MTPRRRLVLGLIAVVLAGAGAWVGAQILTGPDDPGGEPPDREAGRRFQAVLAQLVLRDAGLSSRQEPLALSAADINAFLAGNVEIRDPPVWPVRVWIDANGIGAGGTTTAGRLLGRGVTPSIEAILPGAVGSYPVWVAASGEIVVRAGRAEFQAHTAMIGRQRVPVAVLWRFLGGRPSALIWRMPRVVERVDVEPGRLLIHTRRAGARPAPQG